MGSSNVVSLFDENAATSERPASRPEASEQSQEYIARCIERFDRWWPTAPEPVKAHISALVAERRELASAQRWNSEAREVLEFFNKVRERAGDGLRGYKPVDSNLRHIRGRLAEGVTVQELRAVVAVKWREVQAGEFDARYFRPETIFNATKFQSYLAQLPTGGE